MTYLYMHDQSYIFVNDMEHFSSSSRLIKSQLNRQVINVPSVVIIYFGWY